MKHPPAPSSAIECANIAWLASAGARATVCCTREHGHAGPPLRRGSRRRMDKGAALTDEELAEACDLPPSEIRCPECSRSFQKRCHTSRDVRIQGGPAGYAAHRRVVHGDGNTR